MDMLKSGMGARSFIKKELSNDANSFVDIFDELGFRNIELYYDDRSNSYVIAGKLPGTKLIIRYFCNSDIIYLWRPDNPNYYIKQSSTNLKQLRTYIKYYLKD